MRILLIHAHYRSDVPSGENLNFRALQRMLVGAGHEVRTFERHGDEVLQLRPTAVVEAALLTPWNPMTARALAAVVRDFRPDLAHVENTFPLLSPSVLWTLDRMGIPTVAGIHNYRSWCAAGVAYRDGRPCRDCLVRSSVWPALRHGCYKGSRLATIPLAATIALHRRLATLATRPRLLIANSEFMRDSLVAYGVPGERIVSIPNFVSDPGGPVPWENRDHRVLFAGRLGAEKGAADLVRAWALLPADAPTLEILGDGPQRHSLEALAAELRLERRLRFTGRVAPAEVSRRMAHSKLVVFPSRWYETFGRGIVEAYAHGVPALASRIGALPELIVRGSTGELYEAGDSAQLAMRVQGLFADDDLLAEMARRARARYLQGYTPAATLARLQAAYADAKAGDPIAEARRA